MSKKKIRINNQQRLPINNALSLSQLIESLATSRAGCCKTGLPSHIVKHSSFAYVNDIGCNDFIEMRVTAANGMLVMLERYVTIISVCKRSWYKRFMSFLRLTWKKSGNSLSRVCSCLCYSLLYRLSSLQQTTLIYWFTGRIGHLKNHINTAHFFKGSWSQNTGHKVLGIRAGGKKRWFKYK